MFHLSGVAFVTGAGGAVGRAVCIQFARDGVTRIAGLDISSESLDDTVNELVKEGLKVDFVKLVANLTQESEVEQAIQQTVAAFGRIDYACNVAGIGQRLAPTSEATLDEFDKVMAVNLRGCFLCEKYLLRQMEKQEPLIPSDYSPSRPPSRGVIVNVDSTLGYLVMPNLSLYNISKHAVLGLTRTDALDFARKGIRVNAVCPGFIDTPLLLDSTRVALAKNIDKTAQGRLANPQEVADSIIFLSSDRASHITGIALPVDGGYSLH